MGTWADACCASFPLAAQIPVNKANTADRAQKGVEAWNLFFAQLIDSLSGGSTGWQTIGGEFFHSYSCVWATDFGPMFVHDHFMCWLPCQLNVLVEIRPQVQRPVAGLFGRRWRRGSGVGKARHCEIFWLRSLLHGVPRSHEGYRSRDLAPQFIKKHAVDDDDDDDDGDGDARRNQCEII